MSTYISGSAAYSGYNPGGPTGPHKRMEWHHDWINVEDATSALSWYCPFYMSPERAIEWQYRFRTLTADFALTVAGFAHNYNPQLLRKYNGATIADELDLRWPGIRAADTYATPSLGPNRYFGSVNDDGWNGPGSTLDLEITAHVFSKQQPTVNGSPVDIPHMLWQQDGLLIVPSIYLTGNLIFTTPGSEYAFFFTNAPLTSPAFESSCDFCAAHGGGTMDIDFSSVTETPTDFSLAIDPTEFFGWQGRWSTSTGARL